MASPRLLPGQVSFHQWAASPLRHPQAAVTWCPSTRLAGQRLQGESWAGEEEWAGLQVVFFFPSCPSLFQRVDAPSLLRLLLNFDLLEAAAELVLEYVDAVLGRGHQYFGIEVKVTPTCVYVTCRCRFNAFPFYSPFSAAALCHVSPGMAAVHVHRPAPAGAERDADPRRRESLPVSCLCT